MFNSGIKPENIGPALTGDKLIEEIHKAKEQRKVIADGFLYENTILMIAAEPGHGKSTIATQIAIELAAGLPIFQVFNVPKPMKVLYIQTERPIIEFLERAEVISRTLPIVKENLFITDQYRLLNLLNFEHVRVLVECIKRDCPSVEVIIIDPIYPMVPGGLSKDEPASMFCKAMSIVQQVTGAAIYYSHHTSRSQYAGDGNIIEKDDPYYGSQWLKAHITGSYTIKQTEKGITLIKKKDNYKILHNHIVLEYNPETELCHIPSDELPPLERIKLFLKAREIDKKPFYFDDIVKVTQLCNRTVRKLIISSAVLPHLEVIESKKNKRLYKYRFVTT